MRAEATRSQCWRIVFSFCILPSLFAGFVSSECVFFISMERIGGGCLCLKLCRRGVENKKICVILRFFIKKVCLFLYFVLSLQLYRWGSCSAITMHEERKTTCGFSPFWGSTAAARARRKAHEDQSGVHNATKSRDELNLYYYPERPTRQFRASPPRGMQLPVSFS